MRVVSIVLVLANRGVFFCVQGILICNVTILRRNVGDYHNLKGALYLKRKRFIINIISLLFMNTFDVYFPKIPTLKYRTMK